jgi:hypothetical protein
MSDQYLRDLEVATWRLKESGRWRRALMDCDETLMSFDATRGNTLSVRCTWFGVELEWTGEEAKTMMANVREKIAVKAAEYEDARRKLAEIAARCVEPE